MNANTMQQYAAAILATLAETGSAPESTMFLFTGCDMANWAPIKAVLLRTNLVTIEHHTVKPTDRGLEIGRALNTHLAAKA